MIRTNGKGRLIILLVATLIVVVVVIGRYAYLMLFLPSREKPETVQFPKIERGPILDRNGKLLAITTRLDSVATWIPDLKDPQGAAAILSNILSLKGDALLEKLTVGKRFVWIKRKITPTESSQIKAHQALGELAGITLQPEFGRNYPERSNAAHLMGYVGIDNTGLDGIEWSFQKELFPVAMGEGIKDIYGNQVFLTIDTRMQYFLENIGLRAMTTNNADAVTILAMDATSGEVLAYISLPSFDPNSFGDFGADAMINRPIRSAYEPGSVFKIFSISSFLQLGGITPDDTFFCGGYYEDERHGFKIKDLGAHGDVNAQLILKYSCNVGAAKASSTVDNKEFYSILRRFGFGAPTGIPLSGETSGILRKPEKWSVRTKPTIAFGQEISLSAMQIVAAATVFANDGLRLKPLLVKKIVSPDGKLIKDYAREPIAEVVSPTVARNVLRMMETATQPGGTAKRAAIEGIRISGKTGTAQVTDLKTGGYYKDRYIASFIGILPTDKPRLIIYVAIDNPKGEHYYGSRIAAPVFREAAEALIPLMGITGSNSNVVAHSGQVIITKPERLVLGSHVPDFLGKPKRLLIPLFSRDDIDIVVKGEGYVVRQSPAPGTPVRKGMRLVLELE